MNVIKVSVAASVICAAAAMLITIAIGLAAHRLDPSTLVSLWYMAAGFAAMSSASLFGPVVARSVTGRSALPFVRYGALFLAAAIILASLALL